MQESGPTAQILEKLATMQSFASMLSVNNAVSDIDRELLKKMCVELYETILHTSASAQTIAEVKNEIPVEQHPVITVQEETGLFANELLHQAPVTLLNDIPEETTPTELPDEVQQPEEESLTSITSAEPENTPAADVEVPAEPEVTKEVFLETPSNEISFNKGGDELLHEKIAKSVSGQPDLSQKFQSKIESLKSAISLNRKIAFVNELFKENTVEYAKAIDHLNTASDLNDALRILGELKYTYNWDEQDTLFKEFETLVIKRHS